MLTVAFLILAAGLGLLAWTLWKLRQPEASASSPDESPVESPRQSSSRQAPSQGHMAGAGESALSSIDTGEARLATGEIFRRLEGMSLRLVEMDAVLQKQMGPPGSGISPEVRQRLSGLLKSVHDHLLSLQKEMGGPDHPTPPPDKP